MRVCSVYTHSVFSLWPEKPPTDSSLLFPPTQSPPTLFPRPAVFSCPTPCPQLYAPALLFSPAPPSPPSREPGRCGVRSGLAPLRLLRPHPPHRRHRAGPGGGGGDRWHPQVDRGPLPGGVCEATSLHDTCQRMLGSIFVGRSLT